MGGAVQTTHIETVVSFEDNFLLQVTKNNFCILDDADALSVSLSKLMASQFEHVIKTIPATTTTNGHVKRAALPNNFDDCKLPWPLPLTPTVNDISGQIGLLTLESALNQGAGSRPDRFYSISTSDHPIPFAKGSQYVPNPKNEDLITALIDTMGKLNTANNETLTNPSLKDKLVEAQRSWSEAKHKVHGVIERLVTVFEESVFPVNKYTRRKAHFRGSSLYLPGLIKAVISDFNYKKFFSIKAAGGKRMYSVSLVLDISLSMNGHLANCAVESLVILISALQRIGVESFSIILFGETVQYVKNFFSRLPF